MTSMSNTVMRGPRRSHGPRHTGLGYLRLPKSGLAKLALAKPNGEVETTTFGFCCLGFLGSRLLRRCFWGIGTPSDRRMGAKVRDPQPP